MEEKLHKGILIFLVIFSIGVLAVIALLIPAGHSLSETEQLRTMWPLALYFFIFSYSLKALMLAWIKWESIKHCLLFSLVLYSPQIILFLIFVGGSADIQSSLGGFLWWQNLLIIFGFPVVIGYESMFLYSIKGPIKPLVFANLIDVAVRFVFFSAF